MPAPQPRSEPRRHLHGARDAPDDEGQVRQREVLAECARPLGPLDLLLRTPAALVRQLLPGMLERGDGAVLFGLPVTGTPVPPVGNVATVAAAARAYLHNLHADLAGTGVYAGLVQVASMVGDSDAAKYVTENWDPGMLPEPLNPADLADALWDLYLKRDRFEEVVGLPAAEAAETRRRAETVSVIPVPATQSSRSGPETYAARASLPPRRSAVGSMITLRCPHQVSQVARWQQVANSSQPLRTHDRFHLFALPAT